MEKQFIRYTNTNNLILFSIILIPIYLDTIWFLFVCDIIDIVILVFGVLSYAQ